MGQKVNPHGLRVGVIKNWDSRWYANDRQISATLSLRTTTFVNFLKKSLYAAGVPKN